MCGIAGIVRPGEPPRPGEIERMTAALAHRGPDGAGAWSDGLVALGHRRLAIIDRGGGRQPMTSDDGSLALTYNGEVYDHGRLREELEGRGHRFRTRSDTEVVLRAYEEWGEECPARLRGMFAFAIADRRRQCLFLARDPLGVKPLFLYRGAGCFAFASEIQAFKAIDGVRLSVDRAALDEFLRLRYIPGPGTAFREVEALAPGHSLCVPHDGAAPAQRRYWDLEFQSDPSRSEAEWVAELGDALRDSVASHLIADVPCGAFLSGGVDSAAIVGLMAQASSQPVKTFAISFAEAECDEAPHAAEVARRWGCEHHVERIGREALALLPEVVRHHGEPFGDPAALPMWQLSRMARREVAVVLSGDGGDELLAGYESYVDWREECAAGRPEIEAWLRQLTYFPAELRGPIWRAELRPDPARDAVAAAFAAPRTARLQQRPQYADVKTYLPADILAKVDRSGMAHGLEARVPFVDRTVFERLAQVPPELNLRRGATGAWESKRLLKKLIEPWYPAALVHRPKHGLAVPLGKWLFDGPHAAGELRERLAGPGSLLPEWFEPARVRELVREDHAAHVWLLLVLEEWLQQNRTASA